MFKFMLLLFCGGIVFHSSLAAQVQIGEQAITFQLPDTSGQIIDFEDFQGKVIMLNFFATWCGPCQVEAPFLQDSIWNVYKDKNFVLIALDFRENRRLMKQFINQYGLTYPVLLDSLGQVFDAYGLRLFPTSIFIDQQGKVAYLKEGFNISEFQHVIDSLLQPSALSERFVPKPISSIEIIGNYPNPFNGATEILFRLNQAAPVSLSLFDVNGRFIAKYQGHFNRGTNHFRLRLNPLGSGTYFYQLQMAGQRATGRLIFQK